MNRRFSRIFILHLWLLSTIYPQGEFLGRIKNEAAQFSGKQTPFWAKMNRWGLDASIDNNPLTTLAISSTQSLRSHWRVIGGLEGTFFGSKAVAIPEVYLGIAAKGFLAVLGRNKFQLGEHYTPLSLGSMIVGSNALPIPRISFSIPDYKIVGLKNISLKIKGGISHGWLDKGIYEIAPNLHEKWFYISYEHQKFIGHLGLVHEAVWGGETKTFGPQPDSFQDFIRVFFLLSGSSSATGHEITNALGNHLGMWDLGLWMNHSSHKVHFYVQHPFEDESGARWLLNYPDGLWGISIHSKNRKTILTDIVLEVLYTMHQSGAKEVSDSTYGWDDYYNNYLYRGGWVYKEKVIGNAMFTLGENEIRDWLHVVNNRIKALHLGVEGQILPNVAYRVLMTASKNYGTYHDRDRSNRRKIKYQFENGLHQFSYRIDVKIQSPFSWKNFDATVSMIGDQGELYKNSHTLILGVEKTFSFISSKN